MSIPLGLLHNMVCQVNSQINFSFEWADAKTLRQKKKKVLIRGLTVAY